MVINVKFLSKIVKSDSCWIWAGSQSHNGYGLFRNGNKTVQAHRLAYELYKGQILPGLQIDHLCRVRNCVNPDHLEAVTQCENIRRSGAWESLKIRNRLYRESLQCKNGHYVNKQGFRHCKECRRISKKNYRLRLVKSRIG